MREERRLRERWVDPTSRNETPRINNPRDATVGTTSKGHNKSDHNGAHRHEDEWRAACFWGAVGIIGSNDSENSSRDIYRYGEELCCGRCIA